MLKYILFIFFFIFFTFYSFAQKGLIKGAVKDKTTGELLIGATVLIGEGVGTVTDLDGKFTIEADYGEYTLKVSYVGYQAISRKIILDKKLLHIKDFKLPTTILSEVEVVADFAIERETPVAFSNVSIEKIEEELASQDIPMILNSTPGVYATQQGGGDGDARVTIRGFSQRNIAVMIDGVPVNDMENGWVFWSNWFGLDMVTRTIQVQRGLGASKIAIPSVGGTINILTKGIDADRGASVKQEAGNNGYLRTSVGLTSGRLKNGWGFTVAGSYKTGEGWVDQTFTQGWFYYLKAEKQLGHHLLSFSAMGAPQKHGQRSFKRNIGVYSKEFASKLGFNSDTIPEGGIKYNQHWGELERYTRTINGNDTIINPAEKETLIERINYYHKPQISLRDFWAVNDKLFISNIAYLSIGSGGGTRLDQSLNKPSDFTPNGQIDFQSIYDFNTGYSFVPSLFVLDDPTILLEIDSTEHASGNILKSSINNHFWYGLLSTVSYALNDKISISGGIDLRSYKGEHYREVYDLIGGDYFINTDNINNPNAVKRVGDKIDYHNDSFVKWGGLFGQVEYKTENWSGFINLSTAYTGYKRIDYFKPKLIAGTDIGVGYIFPNSIAEADTVSYNGKAYTPESEGLKFDESIWKWIPGFTVKGGVNYNLNETMNVFMNLGYLSRAPRFNNVFDFSNEFFVEIKNEIINAVELGYSYHSKKFASNINGYYTNWKNRPVNNKVTKEFPDGPRTVNINGMDALHMGIEVDFAYKITPKLTAEGVVSIGDWTWNSAKDSITFRDDNGNLATVDGTPNGKIDYESFDAVGVHVEDAAQTQYSGSIKYEFKKGIYLKTRGTHFRRNYSNFDPFSLKGDNARRDSWRMPNYYLVDIHAGYRFKVKSILFNLRMSVLNVTDVIYISDAQNNETRALYINSSDFDAKSVGVFFGLGRRYNLSLKITI